MERREFQFEDGSSSKFWAIELDGSTYTVHYGRIGTTGQRKEKTLDSDSAAETAYEKQIAGKVKKGYVEISGVGHSANAPAPVKPTPAAARKKKETSAADGAKPAVEKVAIGELRREIQLEPSQQLVVTWKQHQVIERKRPAFNLKAALKRLESVKAAYGHSLGSIKLPDYPSAEEGQFWLMAHKICRTGKVKPAQAAARLSKKTLDGNMPLEEVVSAYKDAWIGPANLFRCVAAVLGGRGTLEFFQNLSDDRLDVSLHELQDHILSRLQPNEIEDIRKQIAGKIVPTLPQDYYTSFPHDYYVAAMLGCHDEIAAVVAAIPDDYYKVTDGWDTSHYQNPQYLVFGLGDRSSVIAEFKRLRLKLRSSEEVFAWLALTELEALDVIADSVCSNSNKEEANQIALPIHVVAAPEMAAIALRIATDSKAPQVGHDWLKNNPLEGVVGLVPVARGTGNQAKAAREQLRQTWRTGREHVLQAAKAYLEPELAEWLQQEILETDEVRLKSLSSNELPPDLQDAFAAVEQDKLSAWLDPDILPPIRIGSKKLGTPELLLLLCALKSTPVTEQSPLVLALKQHAEPTSLDNFSWKLFEAWTAMGSVAKEKWAMGAIGHLGGDGCVLNLTPLVREWPGQSQHQRAVFGLQCLRAINSDTALMSLNGIALKLKFKGLKEKAKTAMEEIAKAKGMTRDELADRIVPDCGLDSTGSRTFDFGPRQFTFVLGAESKPMVRDAAGKIRPNLPMPGKNDDTDLAEAAVAEWKILKKTLRETLKVQGERMENAMITGRRWTPENFDAFIIKHPFMVNLARQLIFAAYDSDGKMVQTFRVTEDQTIADQNDEDAELPTVGGIGIVHPAHLDDTVKGAWGEVLADYGIIPPFQQLGRTICTPDPGDLKKTEITRFKGPKIPGIVMYGMLERSHWLRDTPADAGGFMQHSKYFESADVTAFISYTGMSIGWYDDPQELESIYFVKGHIEPDWWGDHKNRIKIGNVDKVVISEVLRLANAIAAKAES